METHAMAHHKLNEDDDAFLKQTRAALEKHGLDFADADLVYENPGKITFQSPRKGEARKQDIAMVAARDRVLTLIYVERGTDVQVISFRVASRVEREVYEQTQESD